MTETLTTDDLWPAGAPSTLDPPLRLARSRARCSAINGLPIELGLRTRVRWRYGSEKAFAVQIDLAKLYRGVSLSNLFQVC